VSLFCCGAAIFTAVDVDAKYVVFKFFHWLAERFAAFTAKDYDFNFLSTQDTFTKGCRLFRNLLSLPDTTNQCSSMKPKKSPVDAR
jgi:hypothetical protein